MKEQTIRDQNELIRIIQEKGWDVTSTDLKEYKYCGEEVTAAEIELTVDIEYDTEDDDENPYRVK